MRKIAILLVALMSLYMVAGTVSAADTKADTKTVRAENLPKVIIKGKISSIDTTKNEIVVKDLKLKADKTIAIDPKVISTLKVGDEVKVTLNPNSNVAYTVKVVTRTKATSPKK